MFNINISSKYLYHVSILYIDIHDLKKVNLSEITYINISIRTGSFIEIFFSALLESLYKELSYHNDVYIIRCYIVNKLCLWVPEAQFSFLIGSSVIPIPNHTSVRNRRKG